jgi:hypothetical protein
MFSGEAEGESAGGKEGSESSIRRTEPEELHEGAGHISENFTDLVGIG